MAGRRTRSVFDGADAVVFYMDGGPKHEAVQEAARASRRSRSWAKKGVGIGCMHYGVEVVADQAGEQFKRWIGGHYENMFSCNPIWEPNFDELPRASDHARREAVSDQGRVVFQHALRRRLHGRRGRRKAPGRSSRRSSSPSRATTCATGPTSTRKARTRTSRPPAGRAEAMMWAVERPDGGRGFGFTGGHFHDNWGNDDFRKTVLNALSGWRKAKCRGRRRIEASRPETSTRTSIRRRRRRSSRANHPSARRRTTSPAAAKPKAPVTRVAGRSRWRNRA